MAHGYDCHRAETKFYYPIKGFPIHCCSNCFRDYLLDEQNERKANFELLEEPMRLSSEQNKEAVYGLDRLQGRGDFSVKGIPPNAKA